MRRAAVLLCVLSASLIGSGLAAAVAARADASADGGVLCSGDAACSAGTFTTNGYLANAETSSSAGGQP